MLASKRINDLSKYVTNSGRMPRARAQIIPNTLHGVMSERPETFDLVLQFLKDH